MDANSSSGSKENHPDPPFQLPKDIIKSQNAIKTNHGKSKRKQAKESKSMSKGVQNGRAYITVHKISYTRHRNLKVDKSQTSEKRRKTKKRV